jgi:hypothetical protein
MFKLVLKTSLRKGVTNPNAGPRNGLKIYKELGPALCSALFVSATVPAPMESAGEKARPAKNLKMHNVQMFWANPDPIVKSAPMGRDVA